jgi:hypothetical protein
VDDKSLIPRRRLLSLRLFGRAILPADGGTSVRGGVDGGSSGR